MLLNGYWNFGESCVGKSTLATITPDNIKLILDNDIAKLLIYRETQNLYVEIWIDEETSEFKFQYEYLKN